MENRMKINKHKDSLKPKRTRMAVLSEDEIRVINICAHGIHYFESPELAWLYYVKDLPPSDASAFLNHAEELLEKLRKGGYI